MPFPESWNIGDVQKLGHSTHFIFIKKQVFKVENLKNTGNKKEKITNKNHTLVKTIIICLLVSFVVYIAQLLNQLLVVVHLGYSQFCFIIENITENIHKLT